MKQTDENQIIDHADNMRVAREVVNRQRRKAETPNKSYDAKEEMQCAKQMAQDALKRLNSDLHELAFLEYDNQPNPEALKIAAKLMDGSDVCVMVECDNNFILCDDMFNTMTVGFVRSLFDAAIAIAKVVNPYIKADFHFGERVLKIFDGVMYDRNFRVFITLPYNIGLLNTEILNFYANAGAK